MKLCCVSKNPKQQQTLRVFLNKNILQGQTRPLINYRQEFFLENRKQILKIHSKLNSYVLLLCLLSLCCFDQFMQLQSGILPGMCTILQLHTRMTSLVSQRRRQALMLYVSYPGNFSLLVERQFPQGWGR